MKHNLMTKIVSDLSSGKFRKAGCYILCCLGAVTVFGTAYTLFLSAGVMDSGAREVGVLESVEIDDSYEVKTDGFAVTVHVEGIGSHRAADETKTDVQMAYAEEERPVLLASLQDPVVPQSAGDNAETDEPSDDGSESNSGSSDPQIECQVKKVTEGENYEAMMDQLAEEVDDIDAPTQVMELTASMDGTELDLSGCQITVEVTPTPELIEGVGDDNKKPGIMSMTVFPMGGEAVEQFFTSGEFEYGDEPPVMTVTYTVPDDTPVVYAVQSRAVDFRKLEETEIWNTWVDVYKDTNMVIDLNGHKIKRTDTSIKNPLFYVHSGGSLTIMDSAGEGGGIDVSGLESIVTTSDDDPGLEEPIVNIQGGLLSNTGGLRGILVNTRGTVNMFGGTITGANGGAWAGGGIYAESGSVNIFGGTIKGNASTSYGGGIYANKVEITGGEISENKATVDGGGVWAKQIIMHDGKISKNESHHAGGGVYTTSMLMTDEEISGNKVSTSAGTTARGGGGIYIAQNTDAGINPVLVDGDIKYNMSITGGTISDNVSAHTGGGIFVDILAIAHIRGMNGKVVNIVRNEATDEGYDYDGTKNAGHGFGGGRYFCGASGQHIGGNCQDRRSGLCL